jgi:hypothetical protein
MAARWGGSGFELGSADRSGFRRERRIQTPVLFEAGSGGPGGGGSRCNFGDATFEFPRFVQGPHSACVSACFCPAGGRDSRSTRLYEPWIWTVRPTEARRAGRLQRQPEFTPPNAHHPGAPDGRCRHAGGASRANPGSDASRAICDEFSALSHSGDGSRANPASDASHAICDEFPALSHSGDGSRSWGSDNSGSSGGCARDGSRSWPSDNSGSSGGCARDGSRGNADRACRFRMEPACRVSEGGRLRQSERGEWMGTGPANGGRKWVGSTAESRESARECHRPTWRLGEQKR